MSHTQHPPSPTYIVFCFKVPMSDLYLKPIRMGENVNANEMQFYYYICIDNAWIMTIEHLERSARDLLCSFDCLLCENWASNKSSAFQTNVFLFFLSVVVWLFCVSRVTHMYISCGWVEWSARRTICRLYF